MTFNIKAHYERAVAVNVRLWRQRLLGSALPIDRWLEQKGAIWQAVAAALAFAPTQSEAAALAVDLAPTLEQWGIWSDWLPLLEAAAALALPPDLRVRLLLAQGRCHYLNRNFKDAIHRQEAALSLAEEQGISALIALAHYQLTNAFMGCKAYGPAREHGAQALRLLGSTPSKTLASLYNSLGLLELETGSLAPSEAQFQQALALWPSFNEPAQLARTCLNLALVYQRQSRLTEARACYEQAYKALAPTTSVVDKLKVLNGWGTLHYMTGELAAAETVFRQGLEVTRELQGAFHLCGSLTHNLGNTLLALERWSEAEFYLEKSLILWQQANDDLERANSMGTLGELYEQQGVWAAAVTHYDEALALLEAYPDQQWAQKLAATFHTARTRCAAPADNV